VCTWNLFNCPTLRRYVPYLVASVMLTAAPMTVATVVSIHSLYLTSAFASCLVALAFGATVRRATAWIASKAKTSHGNVSGDAAV
jgi:hypothetical protein